MSDAMLCHHCHKPLHPPAIMLSILYPTRSSVLVNVHRDCFVELTDAQTLRRVARLVDRIGFHQAEIWPNIPGREANSL